MSQNPVSSEVTSLPQDAQGSQEEEDLEAQSIPPPPKLLRQYRFGATFIPGEDVSPAKPTDPDLPEGPPRKRARVEVAPTSPLLDLAPGDYIVRVSLSDIYIQRLWSTDAPVRFERETETTEPSGNC